MLAHWIWLTGRRGLGCRYGKRLLASFPDIEAVYHATEADYRRVEGLPEKVIESLLDKSLEEAEKILDSCFDREIRLLTMTDAAYPARLRQIEDPPLLLYCKGKLPQVDSLPAIGVVGTRSATPYGLVTAKRLGYQLGKCGALLVSGLAQGIDAMAMIGALTAGMPVVGVLGCGVDVVYPRSNASLFRDIAANGCLISEFPPGTPPEGHNFPRRNRIISGLCCGVLIVEAPEKSGALITAEMALDQGRDVFVVPGNIDVPACRGSNSLLRQGAIAVSSGWDVVSEYAALFPGKITPYQKEGTVTLHPSELRRGSEEEAEALPQVAQKPVAPKQKTEKRIDKADSRTYIDLEEIMPHLSQEEKAVASAIGKEKRHVDDVIEQTGLPVAKVLASLTLLEVKGIVQQLPGKFYRLGQKSQ